MIWTALSEGVEDECRCRIFWRDDLGNLVDRSFAETICLNGIGRSAAYYESHRQTGENQIFQDIRAATCNREGLEAKIHHLVDRLTSSRSLASFNPSTLGPIFTGVTYPRPPFRVGGT